MKMGVNMNDKNITLIEIVVACIFYAIAFTVVALFIALAILSAMGNG